MPQLFHAPPQFYKVIFSILWTVAKWYNTGVILALTLPEHYIGQLLYIEPIRIADWNLNDEKGGLTDAASAQAVSGFHLRAKYFLTLSGTDAWCGLVGTIEEESHLFDQFWIGCSVNSSGYPDFTDHLRMSWCQVGPRRPQEPKCLCPSGFPYYAGKGIVAENEAVITEALEAKRLFGSNYE